MSGIAGEARRVAVHSAVPSIPRGRTLATAVGAAIHEGRRTSPVELPRRQSRSRHCKNNLLISHVFADVITPVRAENLDSDVLVMQPANQGVRHDASDLLNRA
jgi:hypothetical protein